MRQAIILNSIATGQALWEDTEGLFISAGPPGANFTEPATFSLRLTGCTWAQAGLRQRSARMKGRVRDECC